VLRESRRTAKTVSEREPAVQLTRPANVIGGWPPSLTFALIVTPPNCLREIGADFVATRYRGASAASSPQPHPRRRQLQASAAQPEVLASGGSHVDVAGLTAVVTFSIAARIFSRTNETPFRSA